MIRLVLALTFSALLFGACASPGAGDASAHTGPQVLRIASLGASTRGPNAQEIRDLGLDFEVRARGQIIVHVEEESAASQASLLVGDVLVILDGVELYSQDDIADILRAHSPGDALSLRVLRSATGMEEEVEVTLGVSEAIAAPTPIQTWEFTSLAQLPAALAAARAQNKKILIGLSGAET
jgi:predicted metalloprotease with PDZ domain